ncbi:MAG: hypothetical protein ABIT76_12035 [Chthoniobacterales bacterium]
MAKSDYISSNDEAFSAQLLTFKTNIPAYATTLGVTPAVVTSQAADSDYFAYVLTGQGLMRNGSQQWTSWKTIARNGGTPPPTGAPMPPAFPASVTATAPGIEVRFRALVKSIKAHANYNISIGEALGIEGTQETAPDLTTIQPDIEASVSGNRVNIDWGWGGKGAFLDQCELQVDRSDSKGFVFLSIDTTPGYTDSTPFPATPTKWTYRAIYRVNDQQVGLWSKPVSVSVG